MHLHALRTSTFSSILWCDNLGAALSPRLEDILGLFVENPFWTALKRPASSRRPGRRDAIGFTALAPCLQHWKRRSIMIAVRRARLTRNCQTMAEHGRMQGVEIIPAITFEAAAIEG